MDDFEVCVIIGMCGILILVGCIYDELRAIRKQLRGGYE